MKITFPISQTTPIEPETITQKIIYELNKPSYRVVNKVEGCLEFIDNIWNLGSRSKAFEKVDGDRVANNKNQASVHYLCKNKSQ